MHPGHKYKRGSENKPRAAAANHTISQHNAETTKRKKKKKKSAPNFSRLSERSKLAAYDERSYHTRLPFASGKEALPQKNTQRKGGGGSGGERGCKAMFE